MLLFWIEFSVLLIKYWKYDDYELDYDKVYWWVLLLVLSSSLYVCCIFEWDLNILKVFFDIFDWVVFFVY